MNWTAEPLVPYKFSAFLHLQQGIDKVTSIIFYGVLFYQFSRSLTKMSSPKSDPNPMFRMLNSKKVGYYCLTCLFTQGNIAF